MLGMEEDINEYRRFSLPGTWRKDHLRGAADEDRAGHADCGRRAERQAANASRPATSSAAAHTAATPPAK
jgi:hypothetical protein